MGPGRETFRLPMARAGDVSAHSTSRSTRPGSRSGRPTTAVGRIATHTASASTPRLNAELRALGLVWSASREEERRRIRRDLHDGVGSTLALLAMDLEVTKDLIVGDPAGAQEVLDQASARAQDAISDVRRTVNDLRPPVLDELGLGGAVSSSPTGSPTPTGKGTGLHRDRRDRRGPDRPPGRRRGGGLPDPDRGAEQRQPPLRRRAMLGAPRTSDTLRIRVEDDGRGIPMPPPTAGQGLASIAARAAELGGTAIVERRDPAGGCVVSVSLPLDTSGADDDV